MPLISVIVPVYKVEPYLCRCVDSVLNQTFTDFELILVDDGSPDGCPSICDEYADKDNRIKVIHKSNGGLSDARNAGLEIAKGKYICFVDSDDWIEPTLLETVVFKLEQGYDMVAFNYQEVTENGEKTPKCWHQIGSFHYDTEIEKVDFSINTILFPKIGWEAWSRVYRRSIIENANLRFADNKKIFAEDLYFTLCYSLISSSTISIDFILYNYYQNSNGIMSIQKIEPNFGRMSQLAKEVEKFLKENNYSYAINYFPVMYYKILSNVIYRYKKLNNATYEQVRKVIIEDIEDLNYFMNEMKMFIGCRKTLKNFYDGSRYFKCEAISIAKYYVDGNIFAFKVRNKLNSLFNYHINRVKKRFLDLWSNNVFRS